MALLSLSSYKNFLACGAQHIICMQCFFSEVGIAAASVQAHVTRVLASCASSRSQVPFCLASWRQAAALVPSRACLRHCRAVPLSSSLLSPPCAVPSGCSRAVALYALFRLCASPVHGPCPALLRVAVLCVWCSAAEVSAVLGHEFLSSHVSVSQWCDALR